MLQNDEYPEGWTLKDEKAFQAMQNLFGEKNKNDLPEGWTLKDEKAFQAMQKLK